MGTTVAVQPELASPTDMTEKSPTPLQRRAVREALNEETGPINYRRQGRFVTALGCAELLCDNEQIAADRQEKISPVPCTDRRNERPDAAENKNHERPWIPDRVALGFLEGLLYRHLRFASSICALVYPRLRAIFSAAASLPAHATKALACQQGIGSSAKAGAVAQDDTAQQSAARNVVRIM